MRDLIIWLNSIEPEKESLKFYKLINFSHYMRTSTTWCAVKQSLCFIFILRFYIFDFDEQDIHTHSTWLGRSRRAALSLNSVSRRRLTQSIERAMIIDRYILQASTQARQRERENFDVGKIELKMQKKEGRIWFEWTFINLIRYNH